MRLRQTVGGYQIAVFTSPTPLRAGPLDISVLVQGAATNEWLAEARVTVFLKAAQGRHTLECQATTEAATNKLFHAALFELPEAGQWDVEVAVEGPMGPARVEFSVEAAEAQPRWRELWPWFTWPALVIALFGVHCLLRKPPRQPRHADSGERHAR
jgi:hypothetical protein